jgi:prepilin-type N-terminal cleavage/methylation domain-containing protein
METMIAKLKLLTWRLRSRFGQRPGLTLLELAVALSLFAVLALVATKAFTKVNDIQNQNRDLQNLEGDLRYAMNVFIDETRNASLQTDNGCGSCSGKYYCVVGGSLYLRDKNNNCVIYSLSGTSLQVMRGATTYVITSSDIKISTLNFSVSSLSDRVLIQLAASGSTDYNKVISYQTAITSDY